MLTRRGAVRWCLQAWWGAQDRAAPVTEWKEHTAPDGRKYYYNKCALRRCPLPGDGGSHTTA